jgi:hypothetical protein
MVGSLVSAGVFVTVLFGALGTGIYRGFVAPLLPKLPLEILKVEAKVLSLGVFAFDTSSLGGGLDEAAIERLRAVNGVENVYPMFGAAFPLRAEGGERFLGRSIRTDLFATGLDPALVASDVAAGHEFKDPGPDAEVVPVLVARRLLELYNSTVASAIQKPRLSEDAVIGFSFELVLGSSYVQGTPDPSKVKRVVAQIVGFSQHASLVGLTVPAATMRRWNELHGGGRQPLVAAYVRSKSAGDAGQVAQTIERMGFAVDDTQKVVGAAVAASALVALAFSLVLLGMAGFAIGQTFFLLIAERRSELLVLRAMGARRGDLFRLVLTEATVVGAIAGFVGIALGIVCALIVDRVALQWVPDIPFKPSSFVAFPLVLLLGAWLLGTLASVLGAWVPARRASLADPARGLRE